jgi:5'-phosphate synthase pdxT subunit
LNELRIGILGIQGDIEENIISTKESLKNLNLKGIVISVRNSEIIENLDGLILPGGESTVIGNLISINGQIFQTIKNRISEGMPVMGTCAGLIMLSKRVYDKVIGQTKQQLLGVLDIVVERNAFGRQHNSFEINLKIPVLGKAPFKGVFIRAPIITSVQDNVDVICSFDDKIVAVTQGNIIATSFHPELSSDSRMHELFVKKVIAFKKSYN